MKRKALWAAVGAGAAYLLRNKDSRDKLMSQLQNMGGKYFPGNASSTSTSGTSGLTTTMNQNS